MPGPIPKRTEERRRRNKPDRPVDRVAIDGDIDDLFGDGTPDPGLENRIAADDEDLLEPAEKPDADEDWHPLVVELYESLSKSGQKIFYEPSDWAVARLLCESMSRDLKPQWINVGTAEAPEMKQQELPLKGANLSAYLKGFAVLGMTEGDRRRMSIELTRKTHLQTGGLPEGVTDINAAREGMFG
jgi:hypothetical protein